MIWFLWWCNDQDRVVWINKKSAEVKESQIISATMVPFCQPFLFDPFRHFFTLPKTLIFSLWVLNSFFLPGRAKPWAPFDRTWSELSAQPAPDWVATEAYDRSTCRGRTWWTPPGTGSCSLQNTKKENVKNIKIRLCTNTSLGSFPRGRSSGLKRRDAKWSLVES